MEKFFELVQASLPEIIGGLVVAAILAIVGIIWRLSTLQKGSFLKRPKTPSTSGRLPNLGSVPQSDLLHKFQLRRNQIVAKVHDNYSIEFDPQLRAALRELNAQRQSQGLKEYYPATRFRLIHPPNTTETGIELHLAPLNFAHSVMVKDPNVPIAVKEYVQQQIQSAASRIPRRLQSIHPVINGHNCHPLGIEIAILTKDGKTLLRRRGASVLLSRMEWDVSFSGYCGEIDRLQNGELDLGLTVEHELAREIGILSADPREIIFTGIHRNTHTGAIDILGIWSTEATISELVDLLAKNRRGITKLFSTTRKAEEPFVWDTQNLIVEFQATEISSAFKDANINISNLMPEALVCLLLGLEALGQSASELIY